MTFKPYDLDRQRHPHKPGGMRGHLPPQGSGRAQPRAADGVDRGLGVLSNAARDGQLFQDFHLHFAIHAV